ncbi:MAG: pectate lyase [Ignavibacteriales bacterium]|nr:pectate lyase [Ignavibacteriales bacterium]
MFIDCSAQTNSDFNQISYIDTTEFLNSAHHWYDIKDTDKIIEPLGNQKKYSANEFEKIADNILLYQKRNGGWPKNYDMQAILTSEQESSVIQSKNLFNTCFDNSATYSQLNYLAKAFSFTKKEKYKTAFIDGIKFILSAQYDNGGWPQFYPDTSGYRKYITFNDGAMMGVMKLLKRIVNKESDYILVDSDIYNKVKTSFNKGIECILDSQIKESDSLLVWCQQHNNITLLPEDARTFEPAAICNGESSEIVEFLMTLQNPNARIIKSIKSAVKWFEASKIFGRRVQTIKAPHTEYQYRNSNDDRILIDDQNAKPIWTRYYSLETHIPIFCNRDGIIVYSFSEVERERRIGYAWYVYDPQVALDKYPKWLETINEK